MINICQPFLLARIDLPSQNAIGCKRLPRTVEIRRTVANVRERFPLLNAGQGLFGNGLKLTTQSRLLTTLRRKPFENIVGKGENAGNLHFLLFPHCFLPFLCQCSIFESYLFCRLQLLSI